MLAARVGAGEGRPLLEGDPAARLAELDRVRRPLYEEIASLVVDVDDLSPDQVVDRILSDPVLAAHGIVVGAAS